MSRLVGVGVGPGDPELVTVRAVRVLREADVVLVPVLEAGGPGRAETTVRDYLPAERIRRVAFALDEPGSGWGEASERRSSAWHRAATEVAAAVGDGAGTVAFATIGDPNVYSTFTYLVRVARKLVPGLEVETVPGIVAAQDLAARSSTVLVEGAEALALVPLTSGIEHLREALRRGDTVIAYKCGARMPEVLDALREAGRVEQAVYGALLGIEGEDVRPAAELDPQRAAPYLSTVIAPPPGRGGGPG